MRRVSHSSAWRRAPSALTSRGPGDPDPTAPIGVGAGSRGRSAEERCVACTDPARKRRTDPGNPDVCPVFDLHRIFTPEADREACATGCRTAGIGCLDCKAVLLEHMLPPLQAIRDRRRRFAEHPREILEILHEGSKRARRTAMETMDQVRAAVKLEP